MKIQASDIFNSQIEKLSCQFWERRDRPSVFNYHSDEFSFYEHQEDYNHELLFAFIRY